MTSEDEGDTQYYDYHVCGRLETGQVGLGYVSSAYVRIRSSSLRLG
jgi:hypothetical protein